MQCPWRKEYQVGPSDERSSAPLWCKHNTFSHHRSCDAMARCCFNPFEKWSRSLQTLLRARAWGSTSRGTSWTTNPNWAKVFPTWIQLGLPLVCNASLFVPSLSKPCRTWALQSRHLKLMEKKKHELQCSFPDNRKLGERKKKRTGWNVAKQSLFVNPSF